MTVIIWHNPRCSKSRQTLKLLQDQNVQLAIREYLKDAPNLDELNTLNELLNVPAIEFIRTQETAFHELNLSKSSSDADLLAAMATHPALIERPIVFANSKARIGRPPENVLEIL